MSEMNRGEIPYIMCGAHALASNSTCTLAEGHDDWHEAWEMEDGILQLQMRFKYSAYEERTYWKEIADGTYNRI